MREIDLSGRRFGRLLVLRKMSVRPSKYICYCECKKLVRVFGVNLTRGNTSSCGCLRKELSKMRKTTDEESRLNAVWRYYRRNAKVRDIGWDLTKETFRSLIKSVCDYCGHYDDVRFIGIDRTDNGLGYTPENSVPCCKWCNRAKGDRSMGEFKKWLGECYERVLRG